MGFLGSLGKAIGFTVSPITWVAARGVELVTGKDDIVRNNPLTYYTDLFSGGSKDAENKPPSGGAAAAATNQGLDAYSSIDGYEKAIAEINMMANK